MSMTSVSVIMTVFVLNLHHRGPRQTRIPQWLKTIMKLTNHPAYNKTHLSNTNIQEMNSDSPPIIDNPEELPFSIHHRIKSNNRKIPTSNLRNIEAIIRSINKKLHRNTFPKIKPFNIKMKQLSEINNINNNHLHCNPYIYRKKSENLNFGADNDYNDESLSDFTPDLDYECNKTHIPDFNCSARSFSLTNNIQSPKFSIEIVPEDTIDTSNNCFNNENGVHTPFPDKVDKCVSTSNTHKPLIFSEESEWLSNKQQEINENILDTLKKVLYRYETEDCTSCIVHEWRSVAQFVDRVLFWIYLVSTLASTLVILVIAPVFRIIPIQINDPKEINMNISSFNASTVVDLS